MNITNPNVPRIFNPRRRDKVVEGMAINLGNNLSWLTHPFGRAYKTTEKNNEGDIVTFPSVYHSNGNYHPVSHNSFLSGATYFILGKDNYNQESLFDVDLSIIFMVNLKKIYPTANEYHITERLVEQVLHVLKRLYGHTYKIGNIEYELDEVFTEFDFQELFKFKMNPLDSFRINGNFTLTDICLGTDIIPGDQGNVSNVRDSVGWGDGDTVGWGDGSNDELGWGDN